MGEAEQASSITKKKLTLKLRQSNVIDVNFMKVKTIVMKANVYKVLVES